MRDAVSPNASLNRAADLAGSYHKLALRLGVRHQVMYRWCKRGFVPSKRALEIEVMFGVPAKELVDPALAEIANLIV